MKGAPPRGGTDVIAPPPADGGFIGSNLIGTHVAQQTAAAND